jgi:hypothetical protein
MDITLTGLFLGFRVANFPLYIVYNKNLINIFCRIKFFPATTQKDGPAKKQSKNILQNHVTKMSDSKSQ